MTLDAVLFAVGCDRYSSVSRLRSAERDALRVYDQLTVGTAAMYDVAASALLLSPNRLKIETCLSDLLKSKKGLDVFSFYFAGHGILVDQSFYLCPSDVAIDAVSVTAINISTVFRAIGELRPKHAYVVVDACFSGGMALDLSAILNSEVLARSPEFGLSVLASARLTKEATETADGGIFTQHLEKLLSGRPQVRPEAAYLGLGDIIRALPVAADPMLKEQTPNLCELNLTGADAFCRNPSYDGRDASDVEAVGPDRTLFASSHLDPAIASRLWRAYLAMPDYDRVGLAKLFSEILDSGAGLPANVPVVEALTQNFIARTAEHEDLFAGFAIRSAAIEAFLSKLDAGDGVREALRSQLSQLTNELERAMSELTEALQRDRHALLSEHSGPGDLYYLPLRLSELLGTIGLARLLQDTSSSAAPDLRAMVQRLLDRYGESIVAVGEDQAPGFLLFLAAAQKYGWNDEAEEVIGRLYNDCREHFGRVLINAPEAADVIDFLVLRRENPFQSDAACLQKPSELVSVILLGAAVFDLDEAIDDSLIELDHLAFSFFVPSSYRRFHQSLIDDGLSLVFKVGHNVWSLKDIRRIWREDVVPVVKSAMPSGDRELSDAASVLSLVLPDRLALAALPLALRAEPPVFRTEAIPQMKPDAPTPSLWRRLRQ